jgi:8-hydroxy-5-deazaflavin:NADPH oxidoreductase
MSLTDKFLNIAVLGGTGKEGSGLALRWAHAGHSVFIGSRSAEKAVQAAAEINRTVGRQTVIGLSNNEAARAANIVVLAVPYAAQRATAMEIAASLAGKILIDVTVPLAPPVNRVKLPEGGSAVAALQAELGPDVRVVSAFQNISAHHLKHLDHEIDCDVLVCSDDKDAADLVVALSHQIGLGAWNAGVLANSVVAEALTSVLIALNQKYKVPGSGIRITGLPSA